MAGENDFKVITITIDEESLDIVNQIVKDKKTNRSQFIREAVREKLARMSYLDPDTNKALGVTEEDIIVPD